jgi:hypothetical protein
MREVIITASIMVLSMIVGFVMTSSEIDVISKIGLFLFVFAPMFSLLGMIIVRFWREW